MNFEKQLIQLFWELNFTHFGGVLPPAELRFSSRLKTTGGQYFKAPKRLIQVSTRYFKTDDPWKEIRLTLGHEMTHYWLDFRGRPCGHTKEFRIKLRACGFHRYSRLPPLKARYLYVCPQCEMPYYRKKRGLWSCGPCSGKRFDPKFKLVLLEDIPCKSY